MTTQTAVEYVNGRVSTTTYIDDAGVSTVETNTYTIGSYDWSKIPDKPVIITNPEWWEVAHKGQESTLNPTYFADAFFKLRGYEQTTPDRPVTLNPITFARATFNKIAL